MKTMSATQKLRNAIAITEVKQKIAFIELKEEFTSVREEYNPLNIFQKVKETFIPTINIKSVITGPLMNFGLGILVDKLTQKNPNSTMSKLIHKASNFLLHTFT